MIKDIVGGLLLLLLAILATMFALWDTNLVSVFSEWEPYNRLSLLWVYALAFAMGAAITETLIK